MIRVLGYYRGSRATQVPPWNGETFDEPSAAVAREAITALHEQARTDPDGAFVWIGVSTPTEAELAMVADVFDLPEHEVEAAGNPHQRPKVEVGADRSFVMMKALSYVQETRQVEAGQVAVFIGPTSVVTVQHGSADVLGQVRTRVAQRSDLRPGGPVGLLHAITGHVVDGYLEVISQVAEEVERLEETVFSPRPHGLSESIYLLKRENLEIRHAVGPLATMANDLVHETVDEVPVAMVAGFRDVSEHLLRVADQAESVDSLLLALMAASNAKATLEQSNDQRRIAAWAALALVPTVVFSLYGMNFVVMPELEWRWGYPAVLVVTAGVMGLLYRRLRRVGWL